MNQELISFVWRRASNRCEYCHFPADLAWLPFQIDHIIAEKHGGLTNGDNLALSCYYCNSFKGPNIAGIDPQGDPSEAVQLFHPRRQMWAEHFKWNVSRLIGLTPVARATISVLRINAPEAIDFRELLLESGLDL